MCVLVIPAVGLKSWIFRCIEVGGDHFLISTITHNFLRRENLLIVHKENAKLNICHKIFLIVTSNNNNINKKKRKKPWISIANIYISLLIQFTIHSVIFFFAFTKWFYFVFTLKVLFLGYFSSFLILRSLLYVACYYVLFAA